MKSECSSQKVAHGDRLRVNSLVNKFGNKVELCAQRYNNRPYGVGVLLAGYDVST